MNSEDQTKLKPCRESSPEDSFAFESYGVKIRIACSRISLLKEIERRIRMLFPPNCYKEIHSDEAVHKFSIRRNKSAEYVLYRGRKKITYGSDREIFLKFFDSTVRLTVAEFAEARIFIHAGVVAWKGKAIIIPGKSFQGKTTLVKELTKRGATYYSDEYAVLDADGYVHPFAKTLSVREIGGGYEQVEVSVESIGGKQGTEPVEVGMILLTGFKINADWQPQLISEGLGMLEMLSHTISARLNPKFSLKVLNNALKRAIIVKTERGEAAEFAAKVLRFFENRVF